MFHSIISMPSPSIIIPSDLAGLNLWLKAGEGITLNGSNVSQWEDQSASANHAIQSTAVQQPAYVTGALNGYPVVRLDGSNDHLILSEVTTRTVLIVLKVPVGAGGYKPILGHTSLYDFHRGDSSQIFKTPTTNSNITSGTTRINSVVVNPLITDMPTAYKLVTIEAIGDVKFNNISHDRSVAGRFFNADIAEVISYNTSLGPGHRTGIENYLISKFAL